MGSKSHLSCHTQFNLRSAVLRYSQFVFHRQCFEVELLKITVGLFLVVANFLYVGGLSILMTVLLQNFNEVCEDEYFMQL